MKMKKTISAFGKKAKIKKVSDDTMKIKEGL